MAPAKVAQQPAFGASGSRQGKETQTSADFRALVEEALRQLNSTSALTHCELAGRLPATIAAARAQAGDGYPTEPTPLEQVQTLREVLVSSIELMNPAGNGGHAAPPDALQYHILYKQYVLGTPTRHIMTRYSIAESTYHRYRREAVSALANHLEAQEEQLRRERKKGRTTWPVS